VLAACAPEATPTPAPAPAAPAAPAATTPAPAVGATPAAGAATTPAPAAAAKPAAKPQVQGRFQVLLIDDYHPDHNAHVRREIEEFSRQQGWQLELSPVAAFLAGADIYQKLLASVQAGDPPDFLIHTLSSAQLQRLGVAEPVTDIVNSLTQQYGPVMPGSEALHHFENEWFAVPFYGRTDGHWARQDVFEKAGINIDTDLETWDQVREACMAVSDPGASMWGWGKTVNRGGDGNYVVNNMMWSFGGALTDETGEVVRLNSPETVAAMRWLSEIYTDQQWARMLPPGVLSWTDPSNNEAFLSGTIAFTSNAGTMYAKGVFDQVPFIDTVRLIPMPFGPPRTRLQNLNSANFYLFRGVRNRDATWATINHMMMPEQQRPLWQTSTGYVVPPYRQMWDDPLVRADENNRRSEVMAWNTPGHRGLSHPGPLTAAADAVGTANIMTDMMGVILRGTSVEDAVAEAHQRAVQIYREFGLRGE
jgi:multiple sugar transport system substrate-binding protein